MRRRRYPKSKLEKIIELTNMESDRLENDPRLRDIKAPDELYQKIIQKLKEDGYLH